jgi:hypothetical protein
MGTAWQIVLEVLLVAGTSLVIPLAIVLGHRHPTGAPVLSSGGSLVAFSALWLIFDGSSLLDGTNSSPQAALLVALGTLLLIAAWTLVLNEAAQARRWECFVPLVLAGFLSFAALLAVLFLRDSCPMPGSLGGGFGQCVPPSEAQTFIMVCTLAGPAAVLAYSLRSRMPWRAGLPEGLSISRLGTADEAGGAGGPARHTDEHLRSERSE